MEKTLYSERDRLNRRYIIIFMLSALAILVPVFIINFVYDPGDIYLLRMLRVKYSDDYIRLLTSSSSGVRQFGNERLVKAAWARRAGDYDAAILGSSQAMQLGVQTPRFHRSFGRTLNLGVSGGTLEDMLIFSHIILHDPRMPKAILIEISPWSMKWGMDDRYMINQDHLDGMLSELGFKPLLRTEPYWMKLLSNAFSFDYFKASLKRLFDPSFKLVLGNPFKLYREVEPFDYSEGYEFAVTLNDGSHVYAKDYIAKMKIAQDNADKADIDYKLRDSYYDENAVAVFEKLADLFRKKNIEIYFLLTPYSPKFFRLTDAASAQRLAGVEKRIREIAGKKNIEVFGSYDPKENRLEEPDFFDFMHANTAALDKISFNH